MRSIDMPLKALTTVLWLQLLLGCVAAVLSWGPIFAGAMGAEWTSDLKKELRSIQRSSEYREPPRIGGLSYSDIVDGLHHSTYDNMHLAGYGFLAAVGLVIVTVIELWLVYGLKKRFTSARHPL